MKETISEVCDLLAQDSGVPFLRYMRSIYLGQGLVNSSEPEGRSFSTRGMELGLLIPAGKGYALSELGFLVGNVAKEYCNWLDSGRKMPLPRPPKEFIADKDVLDLGCGIGRWLWEFQPDSRSATGLELRSEYIEIGKVLARHEKIPLPPIVQGAIEQVDQVFLPRSADFVFCRLVLNYVAIRKTLQKIVPLLRDEGKLWVVGESFRSAWAKVASSRGVKSWAYNSFGLINSLVCEVTGTQINFRYPGRHQMNHRAAYPSRRWWKSTFQDLGLECNIVETGNETICIWGTKKNAK